MRDLFNNGQRSLSGSLVTLYQLEERPTFSISAIGAETIPSPVLCQSIVSVIVLGRHT